MITQERAREILQKTELKKGIEKYKYIMLHLQEVDVSSDVEFQKAFETFYKLSRYPKEFRKLYFNLMEEKKNKSDVSFEEIFYIVKTFYKQIGKSNKDRTEISFSSKLLHTINDSYPIWDSVLTDKNHFNLKCNVKTAVSTYKSYEDKCNQLLNSSEGHDLIKIFNDECSLYAGISDVKKIDFILWQDR